MVGKIRFFLVPFLFLFLLIFSFSASATDFVESYRISIENKIDGKIMVSPDHGENWYQKAKVLVPVDRVNYDGYTASGWVGVGEVAACAVNAIHIKTGWPQTIFSILPQEFLSKQIKYNSYLNKSSSLYTSEKTNQSIFGGGFAPTIGSSVLVNSAKMKDAYVPKIGDDFTIIVKRPKNYPKSIVFENKFKGKVRLVYPDNTSTTVAYVFRPVTGVGRFAGTRYLSSGRIRANHAGVIDISTSDTGRVGGFQIIPADHAAGPDMKIVRTHNQWMVVGPINLTGKPLEGIAPLFRYYLKPQYNDQDILAKDWKNKLLSHFLVEAKIDGRWQAIPVYAMDPGADLPEEANTFLKNVAEIRILFPQ